MASGQGYLALDGLFTQEGVANTPKGGGKAVVGKPPPKPTPRPPLPRPRAEVSSPIAFSYADYLRIHCGNREAALYWYLRNGGRLKET